MRRLPPVLASLVAARLLAPLAAVPGPARPLDRLLAREVENDAALPTGARLPVGPIFWSSIPPPFPVFSRVSRYVMASLLPTVVAVSVAATVAPVPVAASVIPVRLRVPRRPRVASRGVGIRLPVRLLRPIPTAFRPSAPTPTLCRLRRLLLQPLRTRRQCL